jgi:hypothetical protein
MRNNRDSGRENIIQLFCRLCSFSRPTSHCYAYLSDETSHESDDSRVIAKGPNQHNNLFHWHLVARFLTKNIIDETIFAKRVEC